MFTAADKPRPHPDVVSTELPGGEAVLLQLATKQYYSLNITGAKIWNLLKQGESVGGISLQIEREFDVTLQAAEENVVALIQNLVAENLVLPG